MKALKVFVAAAVIAVSAHAQDVPLAFEVVSIKPNNSGSNSSEGAFMPGGRFTSTNTSLKRQIMRAYNLKDYQITGGPAWASTARFDFAATAKGEPSSDEMRLMIRTLLADRF